ncbi:MAG: hypothetical protein MR902_03250 [Campylobacter sp.]|nr:hypothetical protein [Campylobacter sp.]
MLSCSYTPLVWVFERVLPDILALEFSTPRAGDMDAVLKNSKISQNCILGLGVINPRNEIVKTPELIENLVQKALVF